MDDSNKKPIYSESKLISHIKKELDKPDTNYSACLTYMKNLGQLSATKDKEIDDAIQLAFLMHFNNFSSS